jgi:predicted RNase H-like HicB family nuclease
MPLQQFTAVICREAEGYVSLCPEFDVASQADTLESARDNLREALALFFKCASGDEIARRASGVTDP